MTTDKIQALVTGAIGTASVAATNVVNEVAIKGTEISQAVKGATIPSPDEITNVFQILVQLAIGIVTLWRLIKKPKK